MKLRMKNILLFTLLIISFVCNAQKYDVVSNDDLLDKVLADKIENKLYLYKKDSTEKVKIREGSLIKIETSDSMNIAFSKIVLITSKGLYLKPLQMNGKYKFYDTIMYFPFNKIDEIYYKPSLARKLTINFVLLFTFGAVTVSPLFPALIHDRNGSDYTPLLKLSAICIIPTIYEYYRYKHLRKIKCYKMLDWNINVRHKIRW